MDEHYGIEEIEISSSSKTGSQNLGQVEATFERIQFKTATANNGKRRAAQQYYFLLVELLADVGSQHPDRWIKVAFRMSAPLVVRGRSPSHYQNDRIDNSKSPDRGGPSSASGAGSYTTKAVMDSLKEMM